MLCVEGLANLLKRPNGGTNNPLLRAMLDRPDLRMIGVMSDWEFTEFVASDSRMLESFSRIEVSEPGNSETLKIVQQHATSLSQEFSLTISKHVVSRTVALASSFILNECHPAKSIRLLRQVCEDAEFDRTQLGQARDSIELRQVVDAIAEKTGIPAETIGGEEGESDFDSALRDAVVGQNEAVGEVAKELGLIKAGLSEPAKPATVLLFAGLTGVGKSELAKRIAELYSTSRRLQAYAMGNFTEPHSVSGIIGVPPGYVGHEDGGRLINELNADPYSVFLLDEAEKCHPNIWKPFLNLFDEGWIVDQRGRKAYADRAVFILTTNAGDRHIAQMAKSGSSPEQTAEKIKQVLSKVRHERSSQPVFPPQFLSRIKRIIVFKPLTEEAMIGITERVCRRMNGRWEQKREKKILVNVEVIEAIGRHAHELNQKSNGQEGGRVVQKLVGDLIERAVQEAASANKNGYLAASEIHAELSCDTPQGSVPEVKIRFGCTQDATEAIK